MLLKFQHFVVHQHHLVTDHLKQNNFALSVGYESRIVERRNEIEIPETSSIYSVYWQQ